MRFMAQGTFFLKKIAHRTPKTGIACILLVNWACKAVQSLEFICNKPLRNPNRVTEQDLIKACRNRDRRAQQLLFDRFAPVMLGVCKRYVKGQEDAEDVLIEAFFKVLTNIEQFKSEGSLEGWVRRIVVNESLMALRKRVNFSQRVELTEIDAPVSTTILQELVAKDILNLLEFLPLGYRTVFNLYVLEGYKHREIAQHLGISINTSKSQLILAKKKLKNMLEQCRYPGIELFRIEEEEEDTEEESDQAHALGVPAPVPLVPGFS